MDESLLKRVSLILSLLSLFSLYLLSLSISPIPTNTLLDSSLGQEVSVRGRVSQMRSSNSTLFLSITREMTEESTVLLFASPNLSIHVGDFLEIEGSVEEYAGSRELIGNKVQILE